MKTFVLALVSLMFYTSTSFALGPPVPIGGKVLPSSSSSPTLPQANLSPSHCGYQVPNNAIVRKDGTVVDVNGNSLSANIVCSYADVASGTSHGTASNVQSSAAIASSASITGPNNFTIQEVFQEANFFPPAGWYSYTATIQVPDIQANPNNTTFRWYAGLLSDSSQPTVIIAGTFQWLNGGFTAFGMIEPKDGNGQVYSQAINVTPDDVLVVTVQEAPTQDTYNISITDQTSNVTKNMSVMWGPSLPWAVDVMDAHESNGASLASCSELPGFDDIHFGSQHLTPDNGERMPANVVAFNPGYAQFNNGEPPCQWTDFVQNDNGNQSGYGDLIWNCSPTFTCGACGTTQVNCTGDLIGCPNTCSSGQKCSSNQCVTSCTQTTCSAQHTSCGSISDGCGNTLDCGSCASSGTNATCTNGGCSCIGFSCTNLGKTCGTWSNGCNGLVSCGPACPVSAPAPAMPPIGIAALCFALLGFGVFSTRKGLDT